MAARRSANYRSEVSLEGSFGALTVKGRADGYDPDANLLEEIKTYRGDLERMPANHRQLHWAQAKIYGWLLCQQLQLSSIRLALVYFDILSERETSLVEEHGPRPWSSSSTSNAACSCDGPNRNWPTGTPATRPWRR